MSAKVGEASREVSRKASSVGDSQDCRYCVETLYCTDCARMVCAECFLRSHERHVTTDVDKASEELRKEMEEAEQELAECLSAYRGKRMRLEDEAGRFLKQMERLEREVRKRGREIKKVVDEHVASLVTQLTAFKEEVIKDVEEEKEDIERHVGTLEQYRKRCADIRAGGLANRDICRRANKIRVRSGELRQMRRSVLCGPVSSPGVAFEKRDLSDILEINANANIVGKFVFGGDGSSSEFIRMMTDRSEMKY